MILLDEVGVVVGVVVGEGVAMTTALGVDVDKVGFSVAETDVESVGVGINKIGERGSPTPPPSLPPQAVNIITNSDTGRNMVNIFMKIFLLP
jgi:hypothetical protein